MHGLIALYIGYAIYLALFFCCKKRDFLSKEITLFLALKLVILTSLYFLFFNNKMTKQERQESLQQLIVTEK